MEAEGLIAQSIGDLSIMEEVIWLHCLQEFADHCRVLRGYRYAYLSDLFRKCSGHYVSPRPTTEGLLPQICGSA